MSHHLIILLPFKFYHHLQKFKTTFKKKKKKISETYLHRFQISQISFFEGGLKLLQMMVQKEKELCILKLLCCRNIIVHYQKITNFTVL